MSASKFRVSINVPVAGAALGFGKLVAMMAAHHIREAALAAEAVIVSEVDGVLTFVTDADGVARLGIAVERERPAPKVQ